MLQKPGSASSTPRTARSSNKQIQESPDDLIRKLSRLPPNKKCCDCNSKLPNIVNVSLGIFLCPTCAGIHRELPNNPRIKSIGHTTFTKEEVDMIQRQGGNDTMNAIYLANYHPSQERMKPPIDNSDIHILRNWILRKYKDKTWYRDPSSTSTSSSNASNSNSNASNSNSNSNANSNSNTHHHHHHNNNKTSSNSSKNERGIAGMMRQPTVVANIPPKKKQSSSTTTPANNNNNNNNDMVDLFDMGPSSTMTTTATTTTNTDSEWDAFSNSRIQQQQQQQPVTMLMNDFANFDTAVEVVTPSTTTTTNMVPSSFANFDNLTSQPQPVVSVPQLDHNISSNNNNNNTIQFANFSSTPAPPSQPPIQSGDDPNFGHFSSVATMTHNNNSDHNDGFANFDSITSTPITTLTTMSQPTNNNNNNNNFTSVQPQLPMVSQVPPSQQHQHQQQPPPASFDKFDAFDSLQISSNVATTASTTTTTTNDDGSSNMIHQPTTSNTTTTTNTMTAPSSASNILKTTKFQSGQKVYYKSSSYSGPAEIIKVHFDDALEPFYTIVLTEANGKEKQTDDAHLSDYIDHMNQIHRNDDDTTALREEIKNLLMNLSMEQLQQIKQFIVRESVSTTPPNNNALSTTPSSFLTTMNTSEIPVLPVATLEMSVSLPPPPPEMNTNVVVQQQQQDLPPPPQSIAPGQLTQANFSLSMPPPVQQQQQMSPPMDAPSFPQTQVHAPTQYPVATHDASQLNQNLPPQEQSGSFPMPSMNGAMTAMMPQQPSMMAGNGVSATGMMMGNVAPTTMINGPSAGVTISSGFGGIPSPDMGDESKPSVSSLSSLPPPPLTQTQQQMQPQYPSSSTTTMMNPAPPQGYMPQQMPQQPSSKMMTMNQMPSPGPTMMMMQYPIQQGTTIQQNPPITQINGVVAAPQQQPMNQMQGMPGSNDQVPQSPLSPKGNPFDFY